MPSLLHTYVDSGPNVARMVGSTEMGSGRVGSEEVLRAVGKRRAAGRRSEIEKHGRPPTRIRRKHEDQERTSRETAIAERKASSCA